MNLTRANILKLVPAIRMIMSSDYLKCGSFILLDELIDPDPKEVSIRLGSSISIFSGEYSKVLADIEKAQEDIGEFLFIDGMGLLGLSGNKAQLEQKLGTIRKESRGSDSPEPVPIPQIKEQMYNKVVAITGGAMGYGEGIARQLFGEGANVVLMDINQDAGETVEADLNDQNTSNRAFFVKTDVTDLDSVSNALYETVLEFGGLDVMISNAGVLKAGGIDEMDPSSFDFVNRVNYTGYFNCVKATVPIMKTQNRFGPGYFGDIIQINSKSGLEGSKKNFAYAGSKFAGIGLTQSFAMELMTDRIKVNAICPGNFFEGPLWADPKKGLFVQYLNAGKVPGAKTIEDVKRHYESLVPAGRGCRIDDVVKAIKYVIDQEYETGQAVPVSGGQVMLS